MNAKVKFHLTLFLIFLINLPFRISECKCAAKCLLHGFQFEFLDTHTFIRGIMGI
jgi:hypothetical protein